MSDNPEDLGYEEYEDDEPESWISALIEMRLDVNAENQSRISDYRKELSELPRSDLEAMYLRANLVRLHFGKPEYALNETERLEKVAYEDQLFRLSLPDLEDKYESALTAASISQTIDEHEFCSLTSDLRRSYFGEPPDFAHYATYGYWSADEAALLSVRVDPTFTFDPKIKEGMQDRGSLSDRLKSLPFPRWETILHEHVLTTAKTKYFRLKEQIKRARKLGEEIAPIDYIVWADENGISVPEELKIAVKARRDVPNWKARYDDLSKEHEAVVKRRDELQRDLDELRSTMTGKKGDELKPTERRTAYKMIIGMAMAMYRYEPKAPRNSATGTIYRHLDQRKLHIDQDTITKWLQKAAEELDLMLPNRD